MTRQGRAALPLGLRRAARIYRCPHCGFPRITRRCPHCELFDRDKETK